MHLMPGLIKKVFADLKVDPAQYWVSTRDCLEV